ncbi:MAG: hypothetical protein HPY44_09785 [Armatimonadetes bacterium]|nr:hypothetical protein [Armatimonadota bacterium]
MPPENLLRNPGFEDARNNRPAEWDVNSPALVSLGSWTRGQGERSLRIAVDENTPADAERVVIVSQSVDLSRDAGQGSTLFL